jgi:hypothetical protein
VFNFVSRKQPLSSREYQLNALAQLEEAIVKDMNPTEKARVQDLIDRADQHDPLTKQLQRFLDKVQTIPAGRPNPFTRVGAYIGRTYAHFWNHKNSNRWVRMFFLVEVTIFVLGVAGNTYGSIHGILTMSREAFSYSTEVALGQLASSLVAVGFAVWGAVVLPRSRLKAYEQFRRATLVNIFLTQIFMFARTEFEALPGFFFNLALLGLIGFAIRQEQRLARGKLLDYQL